MCGTMVYEWLGVAYTHDTLRHAATRLARGRDECQLEDNPPVLWRATARTPQPADTTHTGVLHKLEKQAGQTVVVFIPLLGVHGLASRTAPRCRRAPSRPCSTGATAASTTS